MSTTDARIRALAEHLEIDPDDIEAAEWNVVPYGHGEILLAEGQEWAVMTDSKADDAWNDSLDNYIDECILPDLPEAMRNYFDTEQWKHDARMDGRGHLLNYWDGSEWDSVDPVTGETFYLYRTN